MRSKMWTINILPQPDIIMLTLHTTKKINETALTDFMKLQSNETFGPVVPYYIAQIYYLQGKYEKVIAYAPALLDSASTKRMPEIARVLGESYYRTARYKEAIPYLVKYEKATNIFLP